MSDTLEGEAVNHRIELNLGVLYMGSLTPFIEAVEQAGLASLNQEDADRVASSLESAAMSIRKAIHMGQIPAKGGV